MNNLTHFPYLLRTPISPILIFFFIGVSSQAVDQQWLSLQANRRFGDQQQLSLNFHRRDTSDLYTKRLLNVYRFHYIFQKGEWQIILGAAYFDMENGTSERRLISIPNEKLRSLMKVSSQAQFVSVLKNAILIVIVLSTCDCGLVQCFIYSHKRPLAPVFIMRPFIFPMDKIVLSAL